MTEALNRSSARSSALARRIKGVAESVGDSYPGIRWEYDVSGSEYFPFRAYASAVRGDDEEADEALVISMQCYRPEGSRGGRLVLYAGIAREGSVVLAESPKKTVDLTGPSKLVNARIQRAVRTLDQWLRDKVPLMQQELNGDLDGGGKSA